MPSGQEVDSGDVVRQVFSHVANVNVGGSHLPSARMLPCNSSHSWIEEQIPRILAEGIQFSCVNTLGSQFSMTMMWPGGASSRPASMM